MARIKTRDRLDPERSSQHATPEHPAGGGRLIALGVLALVMAVLFGFITHLSFSFELNLPFLDRPIVLVVGCFVATFFLYLIAIAIGKSIPNSFRFSAVIIGFAVLFRAIMFISTPIQEVDIYRYIWDGIVLAEGISPFRYPPDQIRLAPPEISNSDPKLQQLIRRYRRGDGATDALNQVHFGQVPTVYPPVSQVVFGAAAVSTPQDATLLMRLRTMKAWLLLFDIGTVLLLISLLSSLRMPIGYSIAYAWCPLVLKEIGNSGHLDSIAIFLTTFAVWLFVRNIMLRTLPEIVDRRQEVPANPRAIPIFSALLPVLFLALAIGAKIYAVVLIPLFLFVAIERLGWKATLIPAIVFIAATIALAWPMLPKSSAQPNVRQRQAQAAQPTVDPSLGVSIFFKYWEMNDFIFMNAVENLKPKSLETRKDPWFSFFPEEPREHLSGFVQRKFGVDSQIAPFLTTRFLLTSIFIIIAVCIALWAARQNHPVAFCRAAFLTLAWFWLLAPTKNPWYWLWALPLIPFAKNRTWYLMSGILFIYYIRFYFEYHYTGLSVIESWSIELPQWAEKISRYQGVDFFDFVVTWLEYLPWYLLLTFETIIMLLKGKKNSDQYPSAMPTEIAG